MSRAYPIMLVLTTGVLAISGCGKSGAAKSSSASTSETNTQIQLPSSPAGTLSRAQLISAADKVCRRVAAKRDLLKFGNDVEFELILPKIASYQQALYGGFSKLTPPASMAGDWHRIVGDTRVLQNSMVQLNNVVKSGQRSKIRIAAHDLLGAFARARLDMRNTTRRDHFADCSTY
jgi:hypothetical protein